MVVSLPGNELDSYIKDSVAKLGLPLNVIYTNNKYSAMAGSDAGLVHNGEIASEASAL